MAERPATGSTVTLNYFVLDHLGSVAVVTTSTGAVQAQLAYDAWGKMRIPTTGAKKSSVDMVRNHLKFRMRG